MNLLLKRSDFTHQDFGWLTTFLDAELRANDGDEADYYAQYNKIDNIPYVVIAYEEKNPVGCGALKHYKDKTAEVKRMFVPELHRGKGISKSILQELENWAKELGYTNIILETGKTQTAAVNLYQKNGYTVIANYDQYVGVRNSVCMMKNIK